MRSTPKLTLAAYLQSMPKFEFCIPTVGKVVPAGAARAALSISRPEAA
jgi:hypothetical protein